MKKLFKFKKLGLIRLWIIAAIIQIGCESFTAFSNEFTVGNMTFSTLDNNNVSLIKYDTFDLIEVNIPETVTYQDVTYTITEIGPNTIDYEMTVFYHVDGDFFISDLKKVTLPNTITKIGDYAFSQSPALKDIELPNSLVTIGANAFSGCRALEEITLPNSLVTIGANAFASCRALEEITLPNSVTSIGQYAFSSCEGLKRIDLGTGLKSIENNAFEMCLALESVIIPNSVETIGYNAFSTCTSLKNISLGTSLKSIGEYAFEFCPFKSISIPNSVTELGKNVFSGCDALEIVSIGNSITNFDAENFTYNKHFTNLKYLILPPSLTQIGGEVFSNAKNLQRVDCYAMVPPVAETTSNDKPDNNPILYVPKDTWSQYNGSAFWTNYFNTINASLGSYDELPFDAKIYVPSFTVASGVSTTVPVSLIETVHDVKYSGFQFDVVGTDKVYLEGATLGENLSGFTIECKKQSNNVTRVIAYSKTGASTTETEGFVNLIIKTESSFEQADKVTLSIKNVLFSTEDGGEVKLGSFYSQGSDYSDSDVEGEIDVNVVVGVKQITIDPADFNLNMGSEEYFYAKIEPSDADNKNVEWSIVEGEEYVTISDKASDHISLIGKNKGSVRLRATSVDGTNVYGESVITVVGPKVSSITITSEGDIHSLTVGDQLQLTAIVAPEDAENKDVEWSSSNDNYATVTQEGLVTAKGVGEVYIYANAKDGSSTSNYYSIDIIKVLKGDSNNNGYINVADVTTTANKVINKPVKSWSMANADVNNDNVINATDVSETVNIILNDMPDPYALKSAARRAPAANMDFLIADSFEGGKDFEIGVSLDSTVDYVALQADILIPEGMEVREVVAGPKASNHLMLTNENEEGMIKVIFFSLNNMAFDSKSETLFTLRGNASFNCGQLLIGEIVASDIEGEEYRLAYTGGSNNIPTGIDNFGTEALSVYGVRDALEILGAEGLNIEVFSLEGYRIANLVAESNRIQVPLNAGVYIINVNGKSFKVIVR